MENKLSEEKMFGAETLVREKDLKLYVGTVPGLVSVCLCKRVGIGVVENWRALNSGVV
jgi:hypothetical protein